MSLPKADDLEQLPEIEKQWAVKAMHHAETYFNLLSVLDGKKLKLTKIDDELRADFEATFPEIDVALLREEDFKTEASKNKWRPFIMQYEKRVDDYNFGSLLRLDPSKDYTQDNTMFATRVQFLCVEIVRNQKGLNSMHCKSA